MNQLRVSKIGQCSNYCIFIAGRWFNSIDDYINLELGVKRFQLNLTKYYYNPIPLTSDLLDFFPSLRTLYLYSENDEVIIDDQIQQYLVLYKISYTKSEELKRKVKKPVEFQTIIYTKEDRDNDFNTMLEYEKQLWPVQNEKEFRCDFFIAEGVKEIEKRCFCEYNSIRDLTIPSSVTSIPYSSIINSPIEGLVISSSLLLTHKYLLNCNNLKRLTMEYDTNQLMLHSNCFLSLNERKLDIIPFKYIDLINDEEYGLSEYTYLSIPNTITSIEPSCSFNYNNIVELHLPSHLHDIPHNLLKHCENLKELYISSEWYFYKERLFRNKNGCLQSICIGPNLDIYFYNSDFYNDPNEKFYIKLNGEQHKIEFLEEFTIPENVTSIDNLCFESLMKLSEIKNLENITQFGISCFIKTPSLDRKKYPMIDTANIQYEFPLLNENEIKQIEEWTGLTISSLLVDSLNTSFICDEFVAFNCYENVIGKEKLLFLIEEIDGEKFGYYLNTEATKMIDFTEMISSDDQDKIQEQVNLLETDNKTFEFNLFSNGRLSGPMKFEIKDPKRGYCYYCYTDDFILSLGDITFHAYHQAEIHYYCSQHDDIFDYHGIENAICGKTVKKWSWDEKESCFIAKRFVIYQMK